MTIIAAVRTLLIPLACLGLAAASASAAGGETVDAQASRAAIAAADEKFAFSDMLPTAWQKRPKLSFNVITEVSPEGRKRRVPSPAEPMYYVSLPPTQGTSSLLLQQVAERPPPAAEIEAAMKKALVDNGYLPIANERQRPDVLITFEFGSNGVIAEGFMADSVSADEVLHKILTADLIRPNRDLEQIMVDRTRFIAGDKIAAEMAKAIREEIRNLDLPTLPKNPDFNSPFQIFLRNHLGDNVPHLVNTAFLPSYVATATAYDFNSAAQRTKVALWQTRMVIEARGVTMDEVLTPLIQNTAPFIGRETEAVTVQKRIDRDGRVEIGVAEVVREPAPGATPATAAPAPTDAR